MGDTEDVLNEIRNRTDAHAEPPAEARTRLKLVRAKACAFPGAGRTYASGSIRQNTFIHPVDDGDGGVVLDRRTYPELGPEGGGVSPARITSLMCALLGPALREVYPKVRCTTSKRGPRILFGRPVDGQDPTVDMVIALTRRNGAGLWIPNRSSSGNRNRQAGAGSRCAGPAHPAATPAPRRLRAGRPAPGGRRPRADGHDRVRAGLTRCAAHLHRGPGRIARHTPRLLHLAACLSFRRSYELFVAGGDARRRKLQPALVEGHA